MDNRLLFPTLVFASFLSTSVEAGCRCYGTYSYVCIGSVDGTDCPDARHAMLLGWGKNDLIKTVSRLNKLKKLLRVDVEGSDALCTVPNEHKLRHTIAVCHSTNRIDEYCSSLAPPAVPCPQNLPAPSFNAETILSLLNSNDIKRVSKNLTGDLMNSSFFPSSNFITLLVFDIINLVILSSIIVLIYTAFKLFKS